MAQPNSPLPEDFDWWPVELDYRAGLLSNREIGTKHGISEGYVRKKAKELGWQRDLKARIRAKAEELEQDEAVREYAQAPNTAEGKVDATAHIHHRVKRGHRAYIGRMVETTMTMLAELEEQTGAPVQLEQLIIALGQNEDTASLVDQVRKITTLPSRVQTMEKLVFSMKNLIGMEREAYGIDDKAKGQANVPANVNINF